jgi:hypothetical protein
VVWMFRSICGEVPQKVPISLVETACKLFHEGIHYLDEIFQDDIYYICANENFSPIAACKFLSKI